jgi:hypothetical protein
LRNKREGGFLRDGGVLRVEPDVLEAARENFVGLGLGGARELAEFTQLEEFRVPDDLGEDVREDRVIERHGVLVGSLLVGSAWGWQSRILRMEGRTTRSLDFMVTDSW